MGKNITYSIFLFSILILLSARITLRAQTPTTSAYYAYYSGYPNDSVEIFLIDPRDATVRDQPIVIPLSGYIIQSTLVSPDGRYIALMLLTNGDERWLGHNGAIYRFYDVWTGAIFDSESFYVNFDFLYPFTARWSPQSSAFIFMANTVAGDTLYNSDAVRLYIMSMETRSPITIMPTEYFQWTPDERYWIESRNTAPHLSLIDGYTQEVVLNASIPNAISVSANVFPCDFEFAENQPYIAFTYPCIQSALNSNIDWVMWFRDIYLWNTETNEVQPITDFTNRLEEYDSANIYSMPPERGYYTEYTYLWRDDELLISVLSRSQEWNSTTALTLAYNPQTQSTRTIEETYHDYLLPNPTNELIASVTETYDLLEQRLISHNLEITTYQTPYFSFAYQLPPACYLDWSPDGAWLFHVSLLEDDNEQICERSSMLPVSFLNVMTGQIQQATIANLNIRLYALGWITLPDENPPTFSFPNGTPTPLPPTQTPGPAG